MVRLPILTRIGAIGPRAGWCTRAKRKQMPTSSSVFCAQRTAASISSPRASSVSAAPDLEEAARLPCFATGTPQAATTRLTAVETFNVCCPSPPVPQQSTALSGASMPFTRSRMALAAAAISTAVSPRADSAMRKASISSELAFKSRILAKTSSASARVRTGASRGSTLMGVPPGLGRTFS